MVIQEAQEKLQNLLKQLEEELKADGYDVRARIIFADRSLRESSTFEKDSVILFGHVAIGTPDLETDEYCAYCSCCEIKTALVNDTEFENEMQALKDDISKFKEQIATSGKSRTEVINEIKAQQDADAKSADEEYNKLKKSKHLKVLIATGILIALLILILIGISFIPDAPSEVPTT